jgi:hypothetical protein
MERWIEERLRAVREPVPGSWEIFRLIEATNFDRIEPLPSRRSGGFFVFDTPLRELQHLDAGGRRTGDPDPGALRTPAPARKRGARRRERRASLSRGPPMAERTRVRFGGAPIERRDMKLSLHFEEPRYAALSFPGGDEHGSIVGRMGREAESVLVRSPGNSIDVPW